MNVLSGCLDLLDGRSQTVVLALAPQVTKKEEGQQYEDDRNKDIELYDVQKVSDDRDDRRGDPGDDVPLETQESFHSAVLSTAPRSDLSVPWRSASHNGDAPCRATFSPYGEGLHSVMSHVVLRNDEEVIRVSLGVDDYR